MTEGGKSFDRKLCTELHELTQASLCGTMTAAQSDRLESLLTNNAAAREMYFDYIRSTLDLRLWAKSQADDADQQFVQPVGRAARAVEYLTRPLSLSTVIAALVMALLISALAFVSVPFQRMVRPGVEVPAEGVAFAARLTGVSDALWADEDPASKLGDHFQAGHRLQLRQGLAEITFNSTARVLLQGPAEFVIEGPNIGRLHVGKLTARASEPARGFTVASAAASIVDLGTEFGVQVGEDGRLDARVFEGTIRVEHGQRFVVLAAGESLCVNAQGEEAASGSRPLFVRSLLGGDPVGRYAEAVLADRPVAYWRLGDRRPQLRDLGPHRLRGKCMGASVGATGALDDDADTSISLDGLDDTIVFPHHSALSFGHHQPFSLELWFRHTGGDEEPRLAGKIGNGEPGYQLLFGSNIGFYMRGTPTGLTRENTLIAQAATADLKLRDGRWHQVVAVREGHSHRLYVDGELAAEIDAVAVNADNQSPVYIGSFAGQGRFFGGDVDEVAIYDSALSQGQIRTHYRAGAKTSEETSTSAQ